MQLSQSATLNRDRIQSHDLCGKGALYALSPDKQAVIIVPMFCKSWTCPTCSKRLATQWRAKIHAAHPERFITLTWDTRNSSNRFTALRVMRKQFPRLVRLIRQKFKIFEYVMIWEFTKQGFPHIHLVQKGAYIPQKWLSKTWARLGCGSIVYIRDCSKAQSINRYITKYLVKNCHETAVVLSNVRLVTASRSFFDPKDNKEYESVYKDWEWRHTRLDYKKLFDCLYIVMGFELTEVSEDDQSYFRVPPNLKVPSFLEGDEYCVCVEICSKIDSTFWAKKAS